MYCVFPGHCHTDWAVIWNTATPQHINTLQLQTLSFSLLWLGRGAGQREEEGEEVREDTGRSVATVMAGGEPAHCPGYSKLWLAPLQPRIGRASPPKKLRKTAGRHLELWGMCSLFQAKYWIRLQVPAGFAIDRRKRIEKPEIMAFLCGMWQMTRD